MPIRRVDVVTPTKTSRLGRIDSAGSAAAAVVMARQIRLRVTPEGGGRAVFYRIGIRGGPLAEFKPQRKRRST
jgi:hypothetical protein